MLEWIDKSAYACAAGWSGRYCVTAYVGNVRFTRPVNVGDIGWHTLTKEPLGITRGSFVSAALGR